MTQKFVLLIAMACHEANKIWCESNGDKSQKHWEDAEEWQKESAINGVLFRLANPEAKEDAQHNNWMKEKIEGGWVYGEEKNVELKTHPCIVPFDKLPDFQQKKDKIFCAIVDSLVAILAENVQSDQQESQANRSLTFGEKAVGLSFNSSNDNLVGSIKRKYASVIDDMNDLRSSSESSEQKRLASVAITEAQSAQMWAVKAATWKD